MEAVAAKACHRLPESDDLGLVQLTVHGSESSNENAMKRILRGCRPRTGQMIA